MTKPVEARHWLALGAITAFVPVYLKVIQSTDPYRLALDAAGDTALPGVNRDPEAVVALAKSMSETGYAAYRTFLAMDDVLVAGLLVLFLTIAWFLHRQGVRRWAWALAITALVYAAADWIENGLSREMFGEPDSAERLGQWAVRVTTIKWLALAGANLLGGLGIARVCGSGRSWWLALFRDVPYIIDSVWRRTEFVVNREVNYVAAKDSAPARLEERAWWSKPPFPYFLITLVFIAFGPTLDMLCSVVPQPLPQGLPYVGAIVWLLSLLALLVIVYRTTRNSVANRFNRENPKDSTLAPDVAPLEDAGASRPRFSGAARCS